MCNWRTVETKQPQARSHAHALTYNPGVVVVGQHPFAERHQQPKSLLFFGVEQQHRRHNVHSLRCRGREEIYQVQSAGLPRFCQVLLGSKRGR